MSTRRCLVAVLASSALYACQDPPPPAPAPEATPEPTATATAEVKRARVDPIFVKSYRAESCYFGTMALLQARDAYRASLAGGEPGPGKIPSFGKDAEAIAAKTEGAKDGKTAPDDKGASAKAGRDRAALGRAPRPRTLPYERYARSCSVAAGIKTPGPEGLDDALKAYAPFAIDLSKQIAAANAYYAKSEHDGDQFAKGKEYHQKLNEGFDKLEELRKPLGAALEAARGGDANKPAADWSEGRKLAHQAQEAARVLMLAATAPGATGASVAEPLGKLEQATTALRARASEDKSDTWASITAPSFEAFHKAVASALGPEATALDGDGMLELVAAYVRALEGQNRAMTREVAGVANRSGGPQRTIKMPRDANHPVKLAPGKRPKLRVRDDAGHDHPHGDDHDHAHDDHGH